MAMRGSSAARSRRYRPQTRVLVALTTATTVLAPTATTLVAGGTCASVPKGTLSFTCGSACPTHDPCMAPSSIPSSSSSSGDNCRCFAISQAESEYTSFSFLIPFDAATNASSSRPVTLTDVVTSSVDTGAAAWASNDDLKTIAPLNLPSVTDTVSIRGGNSFMAVKKGVVASVDVDEKLIATQSQVKSLELANLNLATLANKICANLPLGLTRVDLTNTALTAFPTAVTAHKTLERLILAYNNLEAMTAEHAIPTLIAIAVNSNKLKTYSTVYPLLTYLNLSFNKLTSVPDVVAKHPLLETLHLPGNAIEVFDQTHAVKALTMLTIFSNNLSTFDAYMPNLNYLDLAINKLTTFPPVIFNHSLITNLFLGGNDLMKNVSFTNEQANYIYTLEKFTISETALRKDCDAAQKYTFPKFPYTVCIVGKKDVSIITGPRIITPSPAATSGSSSSSNPSGTNANKRPSSGSSSSDPSAATNSSSGTSIGVPIAIASAIVVVLLVVAAVVWRYRKSGASKASSLAATTIATTTTATSAGYERRRTGSSDPSRYGIAASLWSDADLVALKVSSDDIQDVKRLGGGAFADVWLVRFRGSELFASKRLRETDATRAQLQSFIDEIKLMATLRHPHIVSLFGAAWVRESDLQALFEFMDNGDLRTYLTNPRVPVQWSADKLQIAIDIAEALVYLHSFDPPLVHRDLKSRNVLLNSEIRAKLADFGVSRYQSEQNTMTAGVGTCRWLAPEVIAGSGDYGSAADIFSFGVVLSELDTHQIPYENVRGSNGNTLIDVALMQLVSTGELTPTLRSSCPPAVATLATRCFALAPADRPSATEAAYLLRTFKKSLESFYI